jgi:hypothetical protein
MGGKDAEKERYGGGGPRLFNTGGRSRKVAGRLEVQFREPQNSYQAVSRHTGRLAIGADTQIPRRALGLSAVLERHFRRGFLHRRFPGQSVGITLLLAVVLLVEALAHCRGG